MKPYWGRTWLGLLVVSACLIVPGAARASNTWNGGGSGAFNWSDNNNWSGAQPTYGTLIFSGAAGTANTMDASYTHNQINWNGSSAWTMNVANSAVLSLYDNGGTQAKVESLGTGGVTINAPITFAATAGAAYGEINAVSSALSFGSTATLTVNGSQVAGIRMFGSTGATTFGNTVSASGKYFTSSAVGKTINLGGSFTCSEFYLMNTGTLNLNSGGTLNGNLRLGGDFGTTGTQDLTKTAVFNLTPAAGGLTFANVVNSVSGNTSAGLAVNSQNTSGANTLSGHLALDSALQITQTAGGTLNITQAKGADTTTGTDIKGQTLTLAPAVAGTINLSGSVYNSTGSGVVALTGTGSLTLSGSNTYAGGTTLATSSTININSTNALGMGVLTVNGNATLDNTSSGTITNANNNALSLSGGSLTFAGTKDLNFGTGAVTLTAGRTFTTTAGTLTLGGTISGATFGLTKAGAGTLVLNGPLATTTGTLTVSAGTLTLAGANTYSGATTLSGGNINVNSTTAFGTSSSVAMNGITLDNTSGSAKTLANNNPITLGGGNIFTGTADLNLGTGAVTLTASRTWTVNAGTLTLGGVIGGAAFGLTKAGAGTLTLSGVNTYTGGTTISAGTVKLGVANAIPGNTFAGDVSVTGTLDLNTFSEALNGLNGAGTVDTVAGGTPTLTVGANGNGGTFSGVIKNTAGTLALVKSGVGTEVLTGVNTYSGGTTINGGTLSLGSGSGVNQTASLGSGSITMNNGSTFRMNPSGSIFPNNNISIAAGATVNLESGSTANGYGGTFSTGDGTSVLTINSASVNPGAANVKQFGAGFTGTVAIGSGNKLNFRGTINSTGNGGDNATFNVTGTGKIDAKSAGNLALGALSGDGIVAGSETASTTLTYTIGAKGVDSVFSGTIIDAAAGRLAAVIKTGAGKLTLSGANTYSGGTTISAGTVKLGAANAIPGNTFAGDVSVTGTLDLNTFSEALNGLNGAGTVDTVAGGTPTLTVGANGNSGSFSGVIQNTAGTLTLIKSGAGTQTLSGVNTYSGGTAVNVGTLSFGNSSSAGTAPITVANGTTLNIANSTTFLGNGVTLSGANATITLTSGNASGGFGGAFTNSSDQTLAMSGAVQVNLSGGGTKQLQNVFGTVNIPTGTGLAFRSSNLANGGDNALFNVVGTLTTRNNGTVALGALSGSGLVTMGTSGANNAGVAYTLGARGTDVTFSGVIADGDTVNGKTVSLTKTGSATQTLSGTNTYTGTTTINAGTLLLNGILAGSGAVAVNTGGTLGGTGAISGVITVNSGGTLAPGTGVGTLTLSNAPTLNGKTLMELNRTNAPTADLLVLTTGTLNYGGTLTVTNAGPTLQAGDTFKLFAAAAANGVFAATNLPTLSAGQNWWTTNNYVSLTVNQITVGSITNTRSKGFGLKIKITDLLTNSSSLPSGGDTFTLASVGTSTNGSTISTNGSYVFFTPGTGSSSNSNESFTYTVADARGGSATGAITVNVLTAVGGPQTITVSGSTATVGFAGIPGYTYAVQRSTNLVSWVTLITTNTPAAGLFEFTDDFSDLGEPPASAYYRTAQP